jgi:hypothetical protein
MSDRWGVGIHLGSKLKSRKLSQINFSHLLVPSTPIAAVLMVYVSSLTGFPNATLSAIPIAEFTVLQQQHSFAQLAW